MERRAASGGGGAQPIAGELITLVPNATHGTRAQRTLASTPSSLTCATLQAELQAVEAERAKLAEQLAARHVAEEEREGQMQGALDDARNAHARASAAEAAAAAAAARGASEVAEAEARLVAVHEQQMQEMQLEARLAAERHAREVSSQKVPNPRTFQLAAPSRQASASLTPR